MKLMKANSKFSMWENNNYTIKWHEKGGNVVTFQNVDNLAKVGTITEKLDPRNSSINTSTLDFEIHNTNDEFTKFLYDKLSTPGKMFFREIVELWKGNRIIYKGFVRSLSTKDAYESSYTIKLESVIGKLKTSIWDREFSEYLNETIADINSTRLAKGFVMSEVGEVGEETKRITFNGHIIDCLIGLFQMVLSKPNITVNTIFLDTNYTNFLDIENLNELKAELSDSLYTSFLEFDEPISDLFSFIQEQIFSVIGVLPIVSKEGKLKLVIHQQPTVGEGITTLTHDDIIKFNSKEIDESQVVNNVKMSYNFVEEEFINAIVKISSSSFEFFGNELIPEKPQEIEIKSINKLSRANQVTFCSNISDLLFARYGREMNVIALETPIQLGFEVELGDFIGIDSKLLVDWETGNRGLESEEVEEANPVAIVEQDNWGGFITGNSLGTAPDGNIVIDTSSELINVAIFKSCLDNQTKIKNWVVAQIG